MSVNRGGDKDKDDWGGPRGAPRRVRALRKKRIDLVGFALIALAIVTGGVGVRVYLAVSAIDLDKQTFCPVAGPHEITAVLIDMSTPLSPAQEASLRLSLEEIKLEIPRYGQISLYAVGPVLNKPLVPEITICNPGGVEEIDPDLGNPRRVERRWQEAFSAKVDAVLDRMVEPGTADASPIMESIQSVALSAFGGHERSGVPKRLVIVSDMLQNTPRYSQYKGVTPFKNFRALPYYLSVRPELENVDVYIFYVRRPQYTNLQGGAHIRFWEAFVADAGGTLTGAESL